MHGVDVIVDGVWFGRYVTDGEKEPDNGIVWSRELGDRP